MESVSHTAEPLWHPPPEQIRNSNLARFRAWLRENRSLDFDDCQSLFQWSVGDLEAFWSAISEYFDVRFTTAPETVLRRDPDPVNTEWFAGGRLNYAEHLLRFGSSTIGAEDDRPAILFCAEPDAPGGRQVLTRAELVDRVNRVATAMRRLGVQQGDRVAGYLPNRVETVIAFLAVASIGAIWSNCPPELSSRGVLDRLTQIEPKILVAVGGYRYGGKEHDRRTPLAEIAAGLPTLQHLVLVEQSASAILPRLGS
ncbi:MAG: AMP-binding protein, partial [Verrucomicrobia bacterium]|nr:AMP-binding protein [Verrucomicrobiota bacterium]